METGVISLGSLLDEVEARIFVNFNEEATIDQNQARCLCWRLGPAPNGKYTSFSMALRKDYPIVPR